VHGASGHDDDEASKVTVSPVTGAAGLSTKRATGSTTTALVAVVVDVLLGALVVEDLVVLEAVVTVLDDLDVLDRELVVFALVVVGLATVVDTDVLLVVLTDVVVGLLVVVEALVVEDVLAVGHDRAW